MNSNCDANHMSLALSISSISIGSHKRLISKWQDQYSSLFTCATQITHMHFLHSCSTECALQFLTGRKLCHYLRVFVWETQLICHCPRRRIFLQTASYKCEQPTPLGAIHTECVFAFHCAAFSLFFYVNVLNRLELVSFGVLKIQCLSYKKF